MRIMPAVLAAAVLSSPAHAVFLGGVDQSFGSDRYLATKVHAGLNLGAVSFTPEYARYSSDNTDGAFHMLSARLGLDTRWAGLGLTAGRTLPHRLYSNYYGGADLAFTLSPMGDTSVRRIGGAGRGAAPTGKGLARVDFGGGVTAVGHKQELSGAVPSATVGQTNVHGFVGASFIGVMASGRLARSFYRKDLQGGSAIPASRQQTIAGHTTLEGNYPSTSLHLSAEMGMLPMVRPFVAFTHTSYMALAAGNRPGDSRAYTVGLRVGLEMLAAEGSYQRLSVSGAKDHNFTMLGVSLRI